MEITDSYQFSFFRKPILNTEPLRAVGIIDIYRYVVGHYAMLPTAALRNLTNKAEAKRYKQRILTIAPFLVCSESVEKMIC